MQIKDLFDPSKDIHRAIEKVITYNASQENRLKAEITEYIVTDSIEEQFERLLSRMQTAMQMGGQNEIGVWVSGFYGSGKSSFTKYLGLALDGSVTVAGVPFLKHLQDRLRTPQTKALLSTLAKQFPAAVILLDLASEMVAGATMEEVSTVLYYKVLQWAGYSRNLKVAALERKLKKDGRFEEFTGLIRQQLNTDWKDVQNDPLVVDSCIPEIAHRMYPDLFKTPTSFSTLTNDYIQFEDERVEEMLDIVRETSGKHCIIFVVDEVGQYVGSRMNLILNLDGLAKNLKTLGDGRVWIIGTAQQTLTEDDPRAALNSPELYKLKDRFPIQIDLESSDIKEICYRRLLGKSPQGAKVLGDLFDSHGPALRHNTKLQEAKYYDADFNKDTFVNLYPFLPAHFDILLHLLGALAKSTGGIGLRSAIKVIQDILIERTSDHGPVADQPAGWLATTVTLYDSLEKDVARAFPSVHKAVGKALIRFPDSPAHQDVAKTVAVLQILGNLPVTVQNVAALMHPGVDAASRRQEVETAVQDLMNDALVPFGEKDGNLTLFSERLSEIDQERTQIPLRTSEARRIFNEALGEAFTPLPSTRLHGSLAVSAGLKAVSGSMVVSIAGDRETIQTLVEFVSPDQYETARARLVEVSRERGSANTVFLLGRTAPEIDSKVEEMNRCREIASRYRNDPTQEVREYCASQADQVANHARELRRLIKNSLAQGSFIFRGQTTAVNSLSAEVLEAAKRHLDDVARQVFDRYVEAPVRAETNLAERFLRTGNLKAITTELDPLALVEVTGGAPRIRSDHKALTSIRDYIDRNGAVDGKRLIAHFTDAPFGWSQDTLRYLLAALLIGGEVKLRVAGREVTVNGQQAIDGLRTNNAFKTVGVSLRQDRPSIDVLARAAERLTELSGDNVMPLEDEISKAATKLFPTYQYRFGPLAEKLDHLGLPGADRVRSLNEDIADVLLTDASDAPQRLGGEESALFQGLKWAGELDVALKHGMEETVRSLQAHRKGIEALPRSGVPGQLQEELAEKLTLLGQRLVQDDFYKHAADLNSDRTDIKARTRDAAIAMAKAQHESVKDAKLDIQRLSAWPQLTQEEQAGVFNELDQLVVDATEDLDGLNALVRQEFEIHGRLAQLKEGVEKLGQQRRREALEKERAMVKEAGHTRLAREVPVPVSVTTREQLDDLIQRLQAVLAEAALYSEIEVKMKLEE